MVVILRGKVVLFFFFFSGSGSCAGQLPVGLQLSSILQEESQREKGEEKRRIWQDKERWGKGKQGMKERRQKERAHCYQMQKHNLYSDIDFVPQPGLQGQVFHWSTQHKITKYSLEAVTIAV